MLAKRAKLRKKTGQATDFITVGKIVKCSWIGFTKSAKNSQKPGHIAKPEQATTWSVPDVIKSTSPLLKITYLVECSHWRWAAGYILLIIHFPIQEYLVIYQID